jgi:hypothetical protein
MLESGAELIADLVSLGRAKTLIARLSIRFDLHMSRVPGDENENSFCVFRRGPAARPILEISLALGGAHPRDLVGLAVGDRLKCFDVHLLTGVLLQPGEKRPGLFYGLGTEETGIVPNLRGGR